MCTCCFGSVLYEELFILHWKESPVAVGCKDVPLGFPTWGSLEDFKSKQCALSDF